MSSKKRPVQKKMSASDGKTSVNRQKIQLGKLHRIAQTVMHLQDTRMLALAVTSTMEDYLDTWLGVVEGVDVVLHGPRKPLRFQSGGEGLIGWVTRHRKPLLVNDVSKDDRYMLVEGDDLTRSELVVPVILDDELLGVLDMHDDKIGRFTEADLQFAESLAGFLGVAIRNAQRFGETEAHAARLKIMAEVAAELSALRPVPDILENTIKIIGERLGYTYAAIALIEGEELFINSYYTNDGSGWADTAPPRLRVGEDGLAGLVASTGKGVLISDVREDSNYIGHPDVRSTLVVPLRLGSRILGVINIESMQIGAFKDSELHVMQALADQVAVALENARLYDMLQESQSQLVESERIRAVGELAAGVAHNFNNLLTSILGYAELMMMEPELDAYHSYLNTITQSAQQGATIAKQLQDFTRIHAGSSLHTIQLKDVIEQAIRITQPRWNIQPDTSEHPIQMITNLEPLPPINGNTPELVEVFTKIILNAVDAMPNGGSLTIKATLKDRMAIVTISDTGDGMDASVRSRVFEPFFTTKGPALGTGLGLSVARGIVKRHGGEISVASEQGKGATFKASFPLKPDPDPDSPDFTKDSSLPKQRILVIDDETEIQELMVRMLSNHEVDVASSGEIGIQLFQKYHHDVVFTDIGMPGLSGWNVAYVLRETHPSASIIAVTGIGKHFEFGQRQASDVDIILPKPFTLEDLLMTLAKAIRMKEERQAVEN